MLITTNKILTAYKQLNISTISTIYLTNLPSKYYIFFKAEEYFSVKPSHGRILKAGTNAVTLF